MAKNWLTLLRCIHNFVQIMVNANQETIYKDVFKEAKFNPEHHFAVDIRNIKISEAVNAIKEIVCKKRYLTYAFENFLV